MPTHTNEVHEDDASLQRDGYHGPYKEPDHPSEPNLAVQTADVAILVASRISLR